MPTVPGSKDNQTSSDSVEAMYYKDQEIPRGQSDADEGAIRNKLTSLEMEDKSPYASKTFEDTVNAESAERSKGRSPQSIRSQKSEYDELAKLDPELSSGNVFDAIAAKENEALKTNVATSLYLGTKKNPDQAGKVLALSNRLGLPADVVERNFDKLSMKEKVEGADYDSLIKNNPGVARFLEDPNNASVAHDDIESLSYLERQIKHIGNQYNQGKRTVELSDIGMSALLGNATPSQRARLAKLEKESGETGDFGITGFFEGIPGAVAQQLPIFGNTLKYSAAGAGAGGLVGATAGATTAVVAGQLGPQIATPEEIVTVPAAAIAGGLGGAFTGYRAGSAIGAAKMEAALSYLDLEKVRDEQGNPLDRSTMVGASLLVGTVNGALEAIGMESVLKAAPGFKQWQRKGVKEIFKNPTYRAALLKLSKAVGEGTITEGVTEGLQSLTSNFGSVMAKAFQDGKLPQWNTEKVLEALTEAVEESRAGAQGGGGMTAITGSATLATDFRAVKNAEANKKAYLELGEAATSTKLKDRSPEAQAALVEQIAGEGEATNVYIPVEAFQAYFQSKDIDISQAASELGISDRLSEANETGGNIEIPLAKWINKVAASEHYTGLQNDIKFNQDGFTVNELKREEADTKEQVKAVDEAAVTETKVEAAKDTAPQVQERIAEILRGTGQFNEKQIGSYAKLFEERYRARAENRGMGEDAFDLFLQQNLDIQAQEEVQPVDGQMAAQTQEQSFEQGVKKRAESELLPVDVMDDLWEIEADGGAITGQNLGSEYEHMLSAKGNDTAPRLRKKYDFNSVMQIDTVQVSPEKRGQGLASRMLDSFIEEAISQRVDAIILNASPMGDGLNLKNLVEFYKRHGFEVIDKTKSNQTMVLDLTPMYNQSGAASPRGRIRFGREQTIIDIFKGKDESTVLHEAGHLWLEELLVDATTEGANPNNAKNLDVVLEWFGLDVRSKDGHAAIKKAVKTEHHEKFARGFEVYLHEGKSPSQALRKAFARFRLWLTSAYKSIIKNGVLDLNVELTPDVRKVFDRMLVGEQESQLAEQALSFDNIDPKALGLSETESARLTKAREEARISTQEALTAKIMDEMKREERAIYKETASQVRAEVEEETKDNPAFRAREVLTAPATEDQPELRLNRAALVEEFGEAVLTKIPATMISEDGIPHQILAETFSFESGTDLIVAVVETPDRADYVDQETKRRVDELFPDIITQDEELHAAAKEAAMNEDRTKVLRMEMEYLAKQNPAALKSGIRAATRKPPSDAVVKKQAENTIKQKMIGELSPKSYERAMWKNAREAGRLVAKGDWDGAFEAKRKQLLNLELYRAAVAAQEEVAKAREKFKRFKKKDEDLAKDRDIDLVNAGRAILQKIGLGKANKTAEEYLSGMKAYDPEMYSNISEIVNGVIQNAAPFKEMTFDNFMATADVVDAIWELAKSTREMEVDGKKVERSEVIEEIGARLKEKSGDAELKRSTQLSDKEKRSIGMKSLKNVLTRVEHWAYAMDKGDHNGAITKYIVRPVLRATAKYRLAKEGTLKELSGVIKKLEMPDPNMAIDAPELGTTLKKPELIMALLHNGNESNQKKLLLGHGWGTLDENGDLDTSRWNAFLQRAMNDGTITKNDMDVVQEIWNLNEKLKPDAQKAHKKMFGYYFNEITAKELVTPFGTYSGGYMPAIADSSLSVDSSIRADGDVGDNPSQMFPTTGRGFTKSRQNNYSTPLSLDMTKIANHVDKVLKFTYIEPAIKDVTRLVKDRGLRADLNRFDPDIANGLLIPWLDRAATQRMAKPGLNKTLDKALSWFRRNSAMQFMALNVTNAIQNTTGFFPAATRVSPKYLAGSMKRYLASPSELRKFVGEASEFMRSRTGKNSIELLKEIDDIILNPSKYEKAKDAIVQHGYVLEKFSNGMVEIVVWNAAYNQAIENGSTEDDAVQMADATVRQTLTSANPEDVSNMETGTPFTRLFTMFSTWFNSQANLMAAEASIAKETGDYGRGVKSYGLVIAMPAIMSTLIYRMMAGQGLDADDDDEYFDDFLDIFGLSQARYITAFIPGSSILKAAAKKAYDGALIASGEKPSKPSYDDRISLSPALSGFERALGAFTSVPKAVSGNGNVAKALRESLATFGLATGLPLSAAAKPLGYAADVASGKAEPSGPVDYARGLVTGKAGKQ